MSRSVRSPRATSSHPTFEATDQPVFDATTIFVALFLAVRRCPSGYTARAPALRSRRYTGTLLIRLTADRVQVVIPRQRPLRPKRPAIPHPETPAPSAPPSTTRPSPRASIPDRAATRLRYSFMPDIQVARG